MKRAEEKVRRKKNQGRIILLMVLLFFKVYTDLADIYLKNMRCKEVSYLNTDTVQGTRGEKPFFFFPHSIFLLCKKDVVNKAAEAFGMPEVKSHLQLFVRTGLKDAKVLSD